MQRCNQEVIAEGNFTSFYELMDEHFVNRSAPAGADNGPGSMWNTFYTILRPALSDLHVQLHAQVAEGEVDTTRKTIRGAHTSPLLGLAPTGQPVAIEVVDMMRLRGGKYYEHWGLIPYKRYWPTYASSKAWI